MAIERLNEENLEDVLAEPMAWIYKHSPTCSVSADARNEVELYERTNDGVPVYQVDVIRQRPLSNDLESRFGIRHESPQVILLRYGTPIWNDSHWRINAGALATRVEEGGATTPEEKGRESL